MNKSIFNCSKNSEKNKFEEESKENRNNERESMCVNFINCLDVSSWNSVKNLFFLLLLFYFHVQHANNKTNIRKMLISAKKHEDKLNIQCFMIILLSFFDVSILNFIIHNFLDDRFLFKQRLHHLTFQTVESDE